MRRSARAGDRPRDHDDRHPARRVGGRHRVLPGGRRPPGPDRHRRAHLRARAARRPRRGRPGRRRPGVDRPHARPPRPLRRDRDRRRGVPAGDRRGAPAGRAAPRRARAARGGIGGRLRAALVALRRPRPHGRRPDRRRRGRPPRLGRARGGTWSCSRRPATRATTCPSTTRRPGRSSRATPPARGWPAGASTRRCRRRTSTSTPPRDSVGRLAALAPVRLCLPHFGPVPDPAVDLALAATSWRRLRAAAAAGPDREALRRALADELPLEATVADPRSVARWRRLGWADANVEGLAGWVERP